MHLDLLLAHFDDLFDAPESVPKLREVALDLALRGQLVPQDASDEPAAALAEHIKQEKGRLYADGVIRKPSTVPPVDSDELPYEIPSN